MINWNVSKSDEKLIKKIVKRYGIRCNITADEKVSLEMTITACHANGCPLDLQRMLEAKDADFWHDIYGIGWALSHKTGRINKGFEPRFAARKKI